MPRSAPVTRPLLVSFLRLLRVIRISLFVTISSPFLQLLTNLPHTFSLSSHSSVLPSLTPLLTGAEHTFAPSLSSLEPELLSLSPFFLLSQSESAFFQTLVSVKETPPFCGVSLCCQSSLLCIHFTDAKNVIIRECQLFVHLCVQSYQCCQLQGSTSAITHFGSWLHLPSHICALWVCLSPLSLLCAFLIWHKEDDVFIAKLPTFEKRCETPAGTVEVHTRGLSSVFNSN